MKAILAPLTGNRDRKTRLLIPLLLLSSAALILISPFVIEPSYSWQANAISESAAQNLQGAWITRLAFLCFGMAVLWLASLHRNQWARGAYWFHLIFGICMISTAAFSHKPWLQGVPFDVIEDHLHSFTATAMGFAFSFGVLVRFFQRPQRESGKKAFDLLALIAATALPLMGWQWHEISGLLQRMLFLIAYLWYGYEALQN